MFYDWCNKGRGMCYPVCGMVRIKQPFICCLSKRVAHVVAVGLGGRLPYVRRHITVNKMY